MATASARTAEQREFLFTERDLKRISALIYQHAGINLSHSKEDMVYSRLVKRLRIHGLRRFDDYLDLLSADNSEEWEAFVNALTTNLTAFFREAHHFPILKQYLAQQPAKQPITIWCAASSTGEEPYSIAITVAEHYRSLTPPVTIIASDLDTQVLAKAEAGVYPLERVQQLSAAQLRQFFLKGSGRQEGHVRVRPELRNLISFRQINLLDANWPLRGPLDAIFCRNVMIYFDKPTQYQIIKQSAPLLRQEGLFFAGHSENFQHAADLIRLVGKTVYQRADSSASHKTRKVA